MYCFTGGKGSGKSYSCVQNIVIPALSAGIPIHTNLALNEDKILEDFPNADLVLYDKITDEELLKMPNGILLIIDEVQLYFGVDKTYSKIDKDVLEFFSMSRHKVAHGFATNVVLISQTLDGISLPLKKLIDTLYKCRKWSIVGRDNAYKLSQYEMIGGSVVSKTPVFEANGKYKKEVYQYYSTNSQGDENSYNVVQVQEKIIKQKTLFSGKPFRMLIIALMFIPFLAWFAISSFGDFAKGATGSIDEELKTNSTKTFTNEAVKVPKKTTTSKKNNPFVKTTKNKIKPVKQSLFNDFDFDFVGFRFIGNKKDYIFSISKNGFSPQFKTLRELYKLGIVVKILDNTFFSINGKLVSSSVSLDDLKQDLNTLKNSPPATASADNSSRYLLPSITYK
jgi:zona occludens toxin